MAKKNALGRGLGALIDNGEETNEPGRKEVSVDNEVKIVENLNEIPVGSI